MAIYPHGMSFNERDEKRLRRIQEAHKAKYGKFVKIIEVSRRGLDELEKELGIKQ